MRRRPTYLRPGHLPLPLRALAVLTWVVAAATLVFGFLPEFFTPTEHVLFDGQLTFRYAPLWPLLAGLAIGSGAAAVGFVFSATSPGAPRYHAALAWCAGSAAPLLPVLLLTIDRTWLALPAAAAWLASTAIVATCVHVRKRPPRPWVGLVLALLVAVPWIPACYANIRLGLALDAVADMDPYDVLDLVIADVTTLTYVPGLAAAFVAAMTAAGVASAAHGRAAAAHQLARSGRSWTFAAAACAIAVVVIGLEVSNFGGIASGYLEHYWSLDDPWAWPHALITAAAIAATVGRSFREPLQQRGDVAATLAVGVSALCVPITLAVVLTVNVVAHALNGFEQAVIGPPPGLDLLILWGALAALIPFAVRTGIRRTLGQAVARVALLYLVPVYVGITADQLGFQVPAVFWGSPAQVVICLVVICCAATLLGALGWSTPLSPDAVVRLALIPLLIVAGTTWLPTVLAVPLTPVIAVTAALFALLWAMPPAAADANEHSGVVLTASAQLLAVVAAAAIVTCLPDVTADDPTLALLLFAIPLSTLLCARVGESDTA